MKYIKGSKIKCERCMTELAFLNKDIFTGDAYEPADLTYFFSTSKTPHRDPCPICKAPWSPQSIANNRNCIEPKGVTYGY